MNGVIERLYNQPVFIPQGYSKLVSRMAMSGVGDGQNKGCTHQDSSQSLNHFQVLCHACRISLLDYRGDQLVRGWLARLGTRATYLEDSPLQAGNFLLYPVTSICWRDACLSMAGTVSMGLRLSLLLMVTSWRGGQHRVSRERRFAQFPFFPEHNVVLVGIVLGRAQSPPPGWTQVGWNWGRES